YHRAAPRPGSVPTKFDARGTFTLGRAGEKVAWIIDRDEREDPSDQRLTHRNRASYDTVHYQSLFESTGIAPRGGIASADRLDKPDARNANAAPTDLRDMVRVFVHQTALWM